MYNLIKFNKESVVLLNENLADLSVLQWFSLAEPSEEYTD